jgi:hypothetical protein
MLTPEQKARILALWEAGETGGQIAAKMKVTRNTVAGILGRMRAAGKVDYRIKPKKPPKIVKEKFIRIKVKPPVEVIAPLPPLPTPAPGTPGIEITRLNLRTCRYIVTGNGTPSSTLYCGGEVTRGAYCTYHGEMCYTGREKIMRPKNDFAVGTTHAPQYSKGQSNVPFPSRLWR